MDTLVRLNQIFLPLLVGLLEFFDFAITFIAQYRLIKELLLLCLCILKLLLKLLLLFFQACSFLLQFLNILRRLLWLLRCSVFRCL